MNPSHERSSMGGRGSGSDLLPGHSGFAELWCASLPRAGLDPRKGLQQEGQCPTWGEWKKQGTNDTGPYPGENIRDLVKDHLL